MQEENILKAELQLQSRETSYSNSFNDVDILNRELAGDDSDDFLDSLDRA